MFQSKTNNSIRVQYAETRLEPIWNCLVDILKDPVNVIPKLEEYTFKHSNSRTIEKKLKETEEQMLSVGEQIKRVSNVYIDGQISESDYKKRTKDGQERLAELIREKTKWQQMRVKQGEQKDRDKILKELYEKIKTKLESASYEDKCFIVKLFIEKINLFHKSNYAEVYFRFPSATLVPTDNVSVVTQQESLRMVLHVKTLSQKERGREHLLSTPGMNKRAM